MEIESFEQFNEILLTSGDRLIVVEFFAPWNGPCKRVNFQVNQIIAEYQDSITILKVDVDKHDPIATQYNVRSIPTFMFFKNKKYFHHLAGTNMEKLVILIDENM